MKLIRTLVFCFLCLIINNGYAQSNLDLEKLTDSIQSILKKEHIPGAFVTVVSKDSVLYKRGIGYADVEQKIPVNNSHLFKIGSISKTFTALAIMKLVEEGKLSIEDKLADIAPEVPFENEWEATQPVRIKHLLEHKAGFNDMNPASFSIERTNNMTAFDEVLAVETSLQSRWQPGLAFAYSNTGCIILAHVIEKITNQRYQEYIKNEILNPLQMHQTNFRSVFPNELPPNDFSIGYEFTDESFEKSRDMKIICEGSGSLLSNADEMGTFLQFLLNKKAPENQYVVSPNTIKTMEALHGDLEVENGIEQGYGLGIYTKTYGTKRIPFYGHGGDIWGFSSMFMYNRELDLGIAFTRNTHGSRKKLIKLLVDTFTQHVEKANQENNIDGNQLLDWEGDYRLISTRSQMENLFEFPQKTISIDITENELHLNRFLKDKKVVYISQNGNAFTRRKNFTPTLHLLEKDGARYVRYKDMIYTPVNSFWFLVFRIVLGLSIVFGAFATLTMLVHVVINIFKKVKLQSLKRNVIVGLPILSMLLPLFLTSLDVEIETIGQFNVFTLFIFLLTTILPIFTIWATYWIIKNWNSITNRFVKIYYSLVVFSGIFLTVYFIYHGWFMKMMWV